MGNHGKPEAIVTGISVIDVLRALLIPQGNQLTRHDAVQNVMSRAVRPGMMDVMTAEGNQRHLEAIFGSDMAEGALGINIAQECLCNEAPDGEAKVRLTFWLSEEDEEAPPAGVRVFEMEMRTVLAE